MIYPNPHGWSKNSEGKYLFERCHIIAYSLSAKLADKRNLFIGTRDLNKSIMIKIENRIKNYIMENDVRILYRVTVKYKGKNQIPTGILIEAKSLNSEFTLCRFGYNIKKNVKFRYSDGTITKDNRGIIKPIQKIKTSIKEKKRVKSKNTNFVVNSQTKKYHIENCKMLNNIDPKYIKEITTKEKSLINNGYSACKVCNQVINIFNISAIYDDYKKVLKKNVLMNIQPNK